MTSLPPPRSGARRRGLGRGLDALLGPIGDTPAEGTRDDEATASSSSSAALVEIDPALVDANPEQPRREFDQDALVALGESIRTHGLLHPIVVERAGARYQLVAGERRLRAVRVAGLGRVPAIVRPAAQSARESLEAALTENLLRADLTAIEEAAAYSRLADTFGLSHEAIALRLGRSRPAVSNTIRLLGLPAPVQRAVVDGAISAGHARALLGLPDADRQEAMARQAVDAGWSVRRTEHAVQAEQGRSHPPRATTARPALSADDEALRRGLEERLGLPVELERRGRGGRVAIAFHDDGDLDALYTRLGGAPL
ncbi:ParB/RepB/Spo0J family partition protein [Candidatus Aeolococcus gillhamiae]|uniref:ParB/RepB/Spo0J family partition protein n=1 Tax=Candidatus Aeolococcus gillhamiae TaxID=3127015 RepID=UPI003077A9D0